MKLGKVHKAEVGVLYDIRRGFIRLTFLHFQSKFKNSYMEISRQRFKFIQLTDCLNVDVTDFLPSLLKLKN